MVVPANCLELEERHGLLSQTSTLPVDLKENVEEMRPPLALPKENLRNWFPVLRVSAGFERG